MDGESLRCPGAVYQSGTGECDETNAGFYYDLRSSDRGNGKSGSIPGEARERGWASASLNCGAGTTTRHTRRL